MSAVFGCQLQCEEVHLVDAMRNMDKVNGYQVSTLSIQRSQFLTSVWSASLADESPPKWFETDEPRIELNCRNLSVTVPAKKSSSKLKRIATQFLTGNRCPRMPTDELVLLDKVSADVKGGEILAVLGPSGAGKTMFLSALLGNPSITGGKISGEVSLNGRLLDANLVAGCTAFVSQKDFAVESLTVDEHMRFIAALRLWQENEGKRITRTNDLLIQLRLQDCRRVELRSLSRGQRKRVAIATQMVARPDLLLLDEPLTGLDASVAEAIMASIARIAAPSPSSPRGCATVCVLHQPRPQCLRFVSKVLLISEGQVAFYGTPDASEEFYTRLYPWGVGVTGFSSWTATLESFMASLNNPPVAAFITDAYRKEAADFRSDDSKRGVSTSPPHVRKQAPWITQLRWLFWRESKDATNMKFFDMPTALFMTTAIVIGLWYTKSNERTFAGMQTTSGLLFMVTSEIIYTNAYSVMFSFSPQLAVLLQEKRLYGPSAYYISKVVSLVPRAVLQTILFAAVVHVFGDLAGDDGISTFLSICAVLCVAAIAATSYGCMLSGVSDEVETAYSIAQPLDLIANSMAGIFGNVHNDNVLKLSWLKFFSTFFYSYECTSILYWSSVNHLDCTGAPEGCPSTGSLVLANSGLQPQHLPRDLVLLCVYIFGCHLIGFIGTFLRYKRQAVY